MPRKVTTEEFIQRAQKVHGDKYDYSLTEYTYSGAPVRIICKVHGEFTKGANLHLAGQGCNHCALTARRDAGIEPKGGRPRMTTEEFTRKAREVHGDKYDYSKTVYGKNNRDKVLIICKECGREFLQSPDKHLAGRGCQHPVKG